MSDPTFVSLFSGIGGAHLGFERAGFKCLAQVEIDKYRRAVLARHWPWVERFQDVREVGQHNLPPARLIVGGDPCQVHSTAKRIRGSKALDMSGEFVRVVRECKPRWFVRENVRSSSVETIAASFGEVGYSYIILQISSRDFTSQSRPRCYTIGYLGTARPLIDAFPECKNDSGYRPPEYQAEPWLYCLTTHRTRMESRDNYVFEDGGGIRLLTRTERARLQGFPDDWVGNVSEAAAARFYGDAMTVNVMAWIAWRIRRVMEGEAA